MKQSKGVSFEIIQNRNDENFFNEISNSPNKLLQSQK